MSVEENKAVVERYHEILNERKVEALEALGEVLAEDYADHSGSKGPWSTRIQGLEQAKGHFAEAVRKHPVGRVVLDDIIGEGDKVAFRWTALDKGKPMANAVAMVRLSDGKIVDDWFCSRMLDE